MKTKNSKKAPKNPKPRAFSTNPDPSGPAPGPEPAPEAPPISGSVTADQPPTDGLSELERLEREIATPKKPSGDAPQGGGKETAQAGEGEARPRRRKFKRPPPENTIRMAIRQYWRFRAWLANRKLQLPPEMFAAILEGTDGTMVEPLVEPVIAVMDEYIPEQWVAFIEEKSPVLTLLIALFEAEQTFAQRINQIASELRKERPADQARPAAAQTTVQYPKKDEV